MTLFEIQALINLYIQPNGNILANEHKSIETEIVNYLLDLQEQVNGLQASVNRIRPRNQGYFTGLELASGNIGQSYTVSGDITSAILQSIENGFSSILLITMANPMPSLNYKVESCLQSLGNINFDNDSGGSVFKIVSSTQFQYSISEISPSAQNLRIHFKITSLD